MPYIEVKVTKELDDPTRSKLKDELGKIICNIPGKSEAVTMIGLLGSIDLYKGGKRLTDGAYIEVKTYTETARIHKEKVNKEIFKLLNNLLSIPAANVYITFYDHKEWGYDGNLI
ncbi:MAG: hypothetical protein HQK53_20430 [Oligoflexia bacterium]|nr:hypothetical protein [Oligoflexia bacterium]